MEQIKLSIVSPVLAETVSEVTAWVVATRNTCPSTALAGVVSASEPTVLFGFRIVMSFEMVFEV